MHIQGSFQVAASNSLGEYLRGHQRLDDHPGGKQGNADAEKDDAGQNHDRSRRGVAQRVISSVGLLRGVDGDGVAQLAGLLLEAVVRLDSDF